MYAAHCRVADFSENQRYEMTAAKTVMPLALIAALALVYSTHKKNRPKQKGQHYSEFLLKAINESDK